uniref:Uncharacterized protein n=1 Tax=Meloidogyne enterolobii TaxID=390850 RepID=A0A6V7WDV2_MELEN|nr:unnamed protein product [Meloidogyne enterolobii]
MWTDGTPFYFTFWQNGIQPLFNPGKKCIKMNSLTGEWIQSCCRVAAPFVCQKPAIKIDKKHLLRNEEKKEEFIQHSKKPLTEQQKIKALTRAERRRLRRSTPKYRSLHASRERIRVEAFNKAFQQVRELLPTKTVYNNGKNVQTKQQRKMSKIETLRSAIEYLRYLEFMLIN